MRDPSTTAYDHAQSKDMRDGPTWKIVSKSSSPPGIGHLQGNGRRLCGIAGALLQLQGLDLIVHATDQEQRKPC